MSDRDTRVREWARLLGDEVPDWFDEPERLGEPVEFTAEPDSE